MVKTKNKTKNDYTTLSVRDKAYNILNNFKHKHKLKSMDSVIMVMQKNLKSNIKL